jgi:hypothetical protein
MEVSTNARVDHCKASRSPLTRTEMETESNLRPWPPLQTAVMNAVLMRRQHEGLNCQKCPGTLRWLEGPDDMDSMYASLRY